MAQGAVARMPQFAADRELCALAASGEAHLLAIASYVHGDLARGDFDETAARDWHGTWRRRYNEVRGAAVDGWPGFNPFKVVRLVLAGERGRATIVEVKARGSPGDESPRCLVRLRVEPATGVPFELTRKVFVSPLQVPKLGGVLEVAYDPADPHEVSYRKDALYDAPVPD